MEFYSLKMDRLILLKPCEQTERGEIVTLARSIAKHGLLVPITVRRILHTDRYEVISGIKRFYACRLARMTSIPAYVTETPSELARVIIKKKEKQDCFEEAESLRSLILNEALSTEELCDSAGYSEKELYSLLKLTKMGEFEREIVRRNGISREIASEIASFDDICKRTELLSEVIQSRLKLTEVQAMCEKERRGKRAVSKGKANRTPKFRDMRLFDNTLSRAITTLKDAGIKANIMSEQKNGSTEYKIRIEN